MSKIFKGIAQVAGIAAAGLALIPGGQPFATVATAISAGAGAVAQITAKPPVNVGSIDDYTVGPSQPFPYGIGRCALSGALIHQEAHGREREDVPNPWLAQTFIYSGGGEQESIDQILVNSEVITFTNGVSNGYYQTYLRADWQTGAVGDAALNTNGGTPDINANNGKIYWSAAHKLTGYGAAQFGYLLDDVDTQYRNGPPRMQVVGRWNKCYDPRLDSTYPGGSGSHRLGDESTYTYSQNMYLHAATYAYGRYANGKQVCGVGISADAIDWPAFVAAADVADANGWTCNGIVYENGEDGELWNNLKLILASGGGTPTNEGGVLSCIYPASRVALDTIVEQDIEGTFEIPTTNRWEKGFNTVIPTYMSEANGWSYVPSDAIEVPTLITTMGERRQREIKFDLVADKDQAAQLSIYSVYDSIEIEPITLIVGRRFINYSVGDMLNTDLPSLGLINTKVVIYQHTIDVLTGQVTLVLKTDTDAKHPFALGQTGTAPNHPALITNAELQLAYDFYSPDKKALEAAEYLSGTNYFESPGFEEGYITPTGGDDPGASWIRTRYIPCVAGKKFKYTGTSHATNAIAVAAYDEARVFISGVLVGDVFTNETAVIPAGTAFVRASALVANAHEFIGFSVEEADLRSSSISGGGVTGAVFSSATDGTNSSVTISAFTYRYGDPKNYPDADFPSYTWTGLDPDTLYYFGVNDENLDGTGTLWVSSLVQTGATVSTQNPHLHPLGHYRTVATDGTGGGGGPVLPPYYQPNEDTDYQEP